MRKKLLISIVAALCAVSVCSLPASAASDKTFTCSYTYAPGFGTSTSTGFSASDQGSYFYINMPVTKITAFSFYASPSVDFTFDPSARNSLTCELWVMNTGSGYTQPVFSSIKVSLTKGSSVTNNTTYATVSPFSTVQSGGWMRYTFTFSPDDLATISGFGAFCFEGTKTTAGASLTAVTLGLQKAVTVSVSSAAEEILDEDYGYTKPENPDADAGLDAGGNLLDQMTATIDDFNNTIDENTQVLIDNVGRVKTVVDGVFGIVPLPITITVSGVVVFLVLRKVVGR